MVQQGMRRRWFSVGASICAAATLIGCAAEVTGQPPLVRADKLTRENAFPGGAPPTEAAMISADDFQRGVVDGSITLITTNGGEEAKRAQVGQLGKDRAALRAVPQAMASPVIQALLAKVDSAVDPLAHPTITARDADGKSRQLLLLSPAEALHQAAMAWARTSNPVNALNAYGQAWQASPPRIRAGLPTPENMAGASLADIDAARARLDARLGAQSDRDLDPVTVEPTLPPVVRVMVPRTLLQPMPGSLQALEARTAAANAGAPSSGIDGPGTCGHDSSGIYQNVWWPLKRFVSPIKQQGTRGTCWTFAAVGALESALQVQKDAATDISEQWFVWRYKQTVPTIIGNNGDQDGGSAEDSLDASVVSEANLTYPSESFWRYNPSSNRNDDADAPDVYKHACNDYSGQCSRSVHQGPLVCSKIIVLTFCGSKAVPPVGGVARPISTITVWSNGQTVPLATLRAYLTDGHTLLASFEVHSGFDAAGGTSTGVVTDLNSDKEGDRGGHEVLIVGYIDNATLKKRTTLAPANGEGLLIIKNSWGCVGDGGYYFVPVSYLSKVFYSLSILNMSSERSARWNTKLNAPALPAAVITKPVASQSGQSPILVPKYVDFSAPLIFAGQIDDPQDGKNCCQDRLTWRSQLQGPLASGANGFTMVPKVQGPKAQDTVTLAAKDSDGNAVSASVMIADAYPVVAIINPVPNTTVFKSASFTVQGAVSSFGSNTPLSCNNVAWVADWWGPGVKSIGCSATIQAIVTGHRTITATYAAPGRSPVTSSVAVNIVPKASSGPPVVNLQLIGAVQGSILPDATIAYTFTDPGGPGDADLSKYTLVWTATYNGVAKLVNPTIILNTNRIEVKPSKLFALPSCVNGGSTNQTVTVKLQVTDQEGLTGSASATDNFQIAACIG